MLERVELNHLSRPASAFYEETTFVAELVLDPPYQRASVWTLEQRRNLIKSLLEGLPIGSVFLNHRPNYRAEPPWEIAVVDGKQRIETLQAFRRDEFGIPPDWVQESPAATFFLNHRDLDDRARITLSNAIVSTYETSLVSIDAEADLYARINFGGTPH